MNNTFTLGYLLNGISRTLKIVDQIIPIFHDSKPLLDNFKKIYSIMINNNEPDKEDKKIINREEKTTTFKSDSPKFFI